MTIKSRLIKTKEKEVIKLMLVKRKVNDNLQSIKLKRITAIKAKMLSSKNQQKNKENKGE